MSHYLFANHHIPQPTDQKSHVIISLTLRQFAWGLMGLFVPIYLLSIGLSLPEVVLFLIVASILRMVFMWPAVRNIQLHGTNHTLAYSYIMLAFFILSLYFAQYSVVGVYFALIFYPINSATFWAARWVDMAKLFGKKHMTEEMGNIAILARLAGVFAPIIGGVVADTAGPEYALLLTFAVLMVAITVIHNEMRTEETLQKATLHLNIPMRTMLRDGLANIGSIFQGDVSSYVWPLFIYLSLSTFTSVGVIIGASTLASILLIKYVSKLNDSGKYPILQIGLVIKTIVHSLRAVAGGFLGFLGVNVANDAADAVYGAPYAAQFLKHAQTAGAASYVFYFEFIGTIGSVLAWTVLLFLLGVVGETAAFQILFIAAIPATALMNLIARPIKR